MHHTFSRFPKLFFAVGGVCGREMKSGLWTLEAGLSPVRDGLQLHAVVTVRLQPLQSHGILSPVRRLPPLLSRWDQGLAAGHPAPEHLVVVHGDVRFLGKVPHDCHGHAPVSVQGGVRQPEVGWGCWCRGICSSRRKSNRVTPARHEKKMHTPGRVLTPRPAREALPFMGRTAANKQEGVFCEPPFKLQCTTQQNEWVWAFFVI